MIRTLLVIIILSSPFFLVAQNHELVEGFVIRENSELTHNGRRHKTYEIKDGSKLVFEYASNNAGDKGNGSVANTKLSFQIPMGVDYFDYKDGELVNCGAVYVQFCLCPDEGISKVTEGSINGEKQKDGSWLVQIDAIAFGRKTQHKYQFRKEVIYTIFKK